MAELQQQNRRFKFGGLTSLVLAGALVVMIFTARCEGDPQTPEQQAAGDSATGDTTPADGESVPAEKPAMYEVPEGDVRALAKFINDLQIFNPTSRAEDMEYRKWGPDALEEAAERIMALEPPEDSPAYLKATGAILMGRIPSLVTSESEQRRELVEEILAYLHKVDLGIPEVRLVMNMDQALEHADDSDLQIEALRSLVIIFEAAEDPGLRRLADRFEGSLRRLELLGQEMRLTGTTLQGDPLNWADYRGKIVLVDFWATWCPGCLAEHLNILRMYELYHERGFDVVGINLDDQRAAMEHYLSRHDFPWTTLYDRNGRSPAADYYGISLLPAMLLVDAEGKVVSLNAMGPELDRLLAEMIGPPEEDPSEEGGEEAPGQETPE